MGRRHAGRADDRLQGRSLAGCERESVRQYREADRKDPPAALRRARSRNDDRGSEVLHRAVDGDDQTAACARQRTTGLLLSGKREILAAHGEESLASRYESRWTVAGENAGTQTAMRSEEHTSELQSLRHLVCRL